MKTIPRIIRATITRQSKDNYTAIRMKLRDMEPFRGNSAKAVWEGDEYVVYSYNTPIVKVGREGNILSYDATYYSHTTSKLQSIIKNVFPETHPTLFTRKET